MTSQPPEPPALNDPAPGASADDARALERLIEIELDVADSLRRIAAAAARHVEDGVWSAGGPLNGVGDVGLSLERVARAVRRTIILKRRLADDDIAKAEQRKARRAEHRAAIQARKDEISGQMVEAIDIPTREGAQIERLYEACDRWVEEHQYDESFLDDRLDLLLTDVGKHLGITVELDNRLGPGGQLHWFVVGPQLDEPEGDEALASAGNRRPP